MITGATILDLTKAFDTVSHSILIEKLTYYGITGSALALLRSYLLNRYQCVKLGTKISDMLKITSGVPQGSVLVPYNF